MYTHRHIIVFIHVDAGGRQREALAELARLRASVAAARARADEATILYCTILYSTIT